MGQPPLCMRRLPCASTCARMNAIYARCGEGLRCVARRSHAFVSAAQCGEMSETSGHFGGKNSPVRSPESLEEKYIRGKTRTQTKRV